jgi:hypothetical protein
MRKTILTLAVAGTALAWPRAAQADDTIRRPGDHPKYVVEIEPHALWGWTHYDYEANDGFGLGGRFSIPIVENGFVPSINNSVAIGFGIDWLHYSGTNCYAYYYGPHYYTGPCYDIGDSNFLFFPIVMQWNFFVAEKWSVFGEPGLVIYHGFFDYCNQAPFPGCGNPNATGVDFAFYAGGRYHVSDHVALVLRIGYPTFSFGVSFM